MREISFTDLEKFTNVGTRASYPYITIRSNAKSKTITFTSGFLKAAKDQMKDMTHAILHYSKEKNNIVFEFTDNHKKSRCHKITRNANTGSMAARSFFNTHTCIDVEKAKGKYLAEFVIIKDSKLGKCWIIDLNHPCKTQPD